MNILIVLGFVAVALGCYILGLYVDKWSMEKRDREIERKYNLNKSEKSKSFWPTCLK